ncbi:MAG: hypothetical protein KAI47_20950, partial [Deltaproteobacteria bacterium]|nr:hypothetical protein [Deltaproteobacteria bacterium]
ALETVASLITEPDAFRTIAVSTAPEAWRIEHGASAPGGSEVISQGRESDSFSATLPTGTDAMLGFDDDEDEEPTRQAPARFFPIVEDEPAEREVVVPLEMLQGGERLPAGGVDLSSGAASLPAARKAWLGATGNPPLLLVTSEVAARAVFEEAARQEGYEVVTVKTGAEAYASALARRPVAVICDIQLPDADGRELLLGVRCDFRIREVPFIIVAIKDMLPAINAQGVVAVRPVMEGLAQALGPRVDLFAQLRSGRDELQGFGESVGIVHLLNTIAAAKVSGHLSLRAGETRNAEVIFGRGEICGVTVNAPQVVVGPLAMLQLIGLSWQMFGFSLEKGDAGRVSLGRLSEIVEAACVQNNTFLARIYSEGMTIPGVEIDRVALDTYLHEQPAQNYEIMLRLAQGESARALAEEDVAPSGSLKSMLFEVRRCGGLRPLSLRPARGECDVPWTVFSPHVAEASTPPALPETPVSRRRRRWPVVLVACFTTVILAIGGFLVYRYVKVDGQIDKVLPWSGGRSTTSRSGK